MKRAENDAAMGNTAAANDLARIHFGPSASRLVHAQETGSRHIDGGIT